jgi:hypothetical protein
MAKILKNNIVTYGLIGVLGLTNIGQYVQNRNLRADMEDKATITYVNTKANTIDSLAKTYDLNLDKRITSVNNNFNNFKTHVDTTYETKAHADTTFIKKGDRDAVVKTLGCDPCNETKKINKAPKKDFVVQKDTTITTSKKDTSVVEQNVALWNAFQGKKWENPFYNQRSKTDSITTTARDSTLKNDVVIIYNNQNQKNRFTLSVGATALTNGNESYVMPAVRLAKGHFFIEGSGFSNKNVENNTIKYSVPKESSGNDIKIKKNYEQTSTNTSQMFTGHTGINVGKNNTISLGLGVVAEKSFIDQGIKHLDSDVSIYRNNEWKPMGKDNGSLDAYVSQHKIQWEVLPSAVISYTPKKSGVTMSFIGASDFKGQKNNYLGASLKFNINN